MKKLALVDPSILDELLRLRETVKGDGLHKDKQCKKVSDSNREDKSTKVCNEEITTAGRDLSLKYTNSKKWCGRQK